MQSSIINKIIKLLLGHTHQCEACGSWDTVYSGALARGWNSRCEQTYADRGALCAMCLHITWDTPLAQHLQSIPHWCIPDGASEQVGPDPTHLPPTAQPEDNKPIPLLFTAVFNDTWMSSGHMHTITKMRHITRRPHETVGDMLVREYIHNTTVFLFEGHLQGYSAT